MSARVRVAVTLRAICHVPAESLAMSLEEVRAKLMPQIAHLAANADWTLERVDDEGIESRCGRGDCTRDGTHMPQLKLRTHPYDLSPELARLSTRLCEAHALEAAALVAGAFLGDEVRHAIEERLSLAGKPLPDWSCTELQWDPPLEPLP